MGTAGAYNLRMTTAPDGGSDPGQVQVFVDDHQVGGTITVGANSTIDLGDLPLNAGLNTLKIHTVRGFNDPSSPDDGGLYSFQPTSLSLVPASVAVLPSVASASFVGTDTTTQGNWRSAYGHDGYDIPADTSAANPVLPPYAQVSLGVAVVGSAAWTTSTADPRALQDAANTGRIASAWFNSPMTFDVNFTDGQPHELTLYALDWDGYGGGRSERIDVIDAATGNTLSSQTISSFGQGEYLSWTITGHVTIIVTNLNPNSNAVVNGLFFDAAASTGTGNAATFLASDSSTQGNWRSSYGGDGYDIPADPSGAGPVIPPYAEVALAGATPADWTTSTTDPRALQDAANTGHIASGWFAGASMTFDVNLTDGQPHKVALYALDWDGYGGGRSERIDVLDAASGAVLSTQTISSFGQGEYLSWTVTGHVTIVVTNLNPNSNAVVNGLFFGPPAAPAVGASFVGTDTTTQGNWRSSYGGDGYDIPADTSAADPDLPSYAQVVVAGATPADWTTSTTDPRALQDAANSGRIASGWFGGSTMTFDVDLTDGQPHELALYALDWDGYGGGRSERIDVLDAASGAVLSTQTISSFGQGEYLSWTVTGHVTIVVTNLNPNSNTVVNGLFFGPPAIPSAGASFLGTDSSTQGNWRSSYGGDGYDIPADPSGAGPVIPPYAEVSLAGATPADWTTSTTDPRALQDAANDGRIASGWFAGASMTFDVDLTDGQPHKVALYALDWDGYGGGRSERIDVLDAASGAVLSTQTIGSFGQGEYLSWTVTGHVKIVVTNLNPNSNAVVNGLFFG